LIGLDPPEPSQQSWAGVIAASAAWVIALAVLLVWILASPTSSLRGQLAHLQFWSLETCVYLGLALTAAVVQELWRTLERRDLVALVALAGLGIGLAAAMPVRTNRIYYDEQLYQSIGQNLAASRRAQMCNDGTIQDGRLHCAVGEYNKQPYAYPHLLSLVYRFLGVRETTAFVVNAVAMGLSVGFVYLVVLILFADRVAAYFAAFLLALTPEQVVWSATAAVEPTASLAAIGAVLAAACFVRSRSTVALAATAVASAYAIQFRPESLLIVPVIALIVWQRARDEYTRPRLWWAGLLFLALAAIHLAHLVAVGNEGWGTTADRFSLAYVAGNLRVNARFFLTDGRFPIAYTVLAIAGLIAWRGAPGRAAMALYFSLFFGVALFFYAGSYDYGADVRYSLATYPPLMIIAGLGASRLLYSSRRMVPALVAHVGVAAALLSQFFWWSAPVVRANDDKAWAARADVQFARSLAAEIAPQSYVLTHNPGMFHVWGVSAGQMSLVATNPAFLDDLERRFPGGVYLHWNFWCTVSDPVQREYCTTALALRSNDVVREHRERDRVYVLYRLTGRNRDR
jgi:Dolichyl-phosphate-mannose-protein mannosyltransferase